MNKKIIIIPIIIIPIIIIIAVGLVNFSSDKTSEKENYAIFHVTLANPKLYVDGTYGDTFTIQKGEYVFRFVPNGSSPEILTINLVGTSINFAEDFKLTNTLHKTEISEYYTWEYAGVKKFEILESQQVAISIDPNENLLGSVSVDILEN